MVFQADAETQRLMTDAELLSRVWRLFDPAPATAHLLKRNGRVLLGLPTGREAAARALRLYQPQRRIARGVVAGLRWLIGLGLLGRALPRIRIDGDQETVSPALAEITAGTCGVMLGSPEHRVRRAIASYRNGNQWEVAKIAFGEAGASLLEREAKALEGLQHSIAGVPRLLGLHRGQDVTVLRMPYLTGRPVNPGDSNDALNLLDSWITNLPAQPITEFSEWHDIESALLGSELGLRALRRLAQESLRPVICHGDFARWNLLRRKDGSLVVLDWEWGHHDGLPGIDLVHYFLQDARLVKRMGSEISITEALASLDSAACRNYLQKTGWSSDPILPIVASLAYKQGAGHQDNSDVLKAALEFVSQPTSP